ncbi:hypothetical protein [Neobacillus bataviensis]|uniref:hypothetical protein n=1 Tax=Neobacillus bataviensis TaxID=220685 RepID=UPI001CBB8345|nr:hypothetical protein [Neobacillus bataviensis]
MNKSLMSFSVIFLGLCVVLSAWIISQSLKSKQKELVNQSDKFRYELISSQNNIILFDKQSGESWRKFLLPMEGPTDWEKQQSPVSSTAK